VSSWYDSACLRIKALLRGLPAGKSEADMRRLLSEAYPWGERKHWPYKMWLKATKACLAERAAWERWHAMEQAENPQGRQG
jgi:hypothetical protein